MSKFRHIFRTSGVPNIYGYLHDVESMRYYPPGGAESFLVDVAVGVRNYVDEQATDGEYKIESMQIQIKTIDLETHNIDIVQGLAVLEDPIRRISWNVDYNSSRWGPDFVVLQLIRNMLHRRPQMQET